MSILRKWIDNEAGWNYLRGFFPSYKITLPKYICKNSLYDFSEFPEIQEFCREIVEEKGINEKIKIQTYITLSIIHSQSEESVQYLKEVFI